MKRSKRFTLRRIALGLAVAAFLVPVAQAKPTPAKQQQPAVEIPYLSHGILNASVGSDDRSLSKATSVGAPSVAAGSGGYDVGPGAVSGFGLALLVLASGAAIAVRHTRRTKLSPA